MTTRPNLWRLAIVMIVAANTGCSVLQRHCGTRQVAAAAPEAVDVGGAVERPQTLFIPPTGLTLRRAIGCAGGLRREGAGLLPYDVAFVALERGLVTYYFPLDLVESGVCGEVRLAGRDAVQLVDVRRTSLTRVAQLDRNAKFTVDGMVRRPGTIHISHLGVAAGQLLPVALSDVERLAGGATSQADSKVALITRASPVGLGAAEQFVIPLAIRAQLPSEAAAVSASPARTGVAAASTVASGSAAMGSAQNPAGTTIIVEGSTNRLSAASPSSAPVLPPVASTPTANSVPHSSFEAASASDVAGFGPMRISLGNGDHVSVTTAEYVPLVLSSLIAGHLKRDALDARRRCARLHPSSIRER